MPEHWTPSRAYAVGAVVAYAGRVWRALRPAMPGDVPGQPDRTGDYPWTVSGLAAAKTGDDKVEAASARDARIGRGS